MCWQKNDCVAWVFFFTTFQHNQRRLVFVLSLPQLSNFSFFNGWKIRQCHFNKDTLFLPTDMRAVRIYCQQAPFFLFIHQFSYVRTSLAHEGTLVFVLLPIRPENILDTVFISQPSTLCLSLFSSLLLFCGANCMTRPLCNVSAKDFSLTDP